MSAEVSPGVEFIHPCLAASPRDVLPSDPTWPSDLAPSYAVRCAARQKSEDYMFAHPDRWRLAGVGKEDPASLGICTQTDPELFYPDVGKGVSVPKRLCGRCALRTECLTGALERGETSGFWGGVNFSAAARQGRKRQALKTGRSIADIALGEQRAS